MTEKHAPRLVLIDGHALAYKMFFARMPDLITRSGEPTKATLGFARTVLNLLTGGEPPDYLAVSFDTGATFRDSLFQDYKGTREKMPDVLQIQIDRIHQILEALRVPILEVEGFEADDVLGTVARKVAAQGIHTLIITGDRDLLQLVDDTTTVELPGNRTGETQTFDPPAVQEKYGLSPNQIVDLKSLIGDQSDNIPGVPGVGEKTATRLLQQYGTLEAIYQHLDEITETRAHTALEAGRDSAFLSYKLAQIVTDAPVTFDLEDCRPRPYDQQTVAALFRELEFRSLLKQISGAEAASISTVTSGGQLSLFDQGVQTRPAASVAEVGRTIVVQDETALDALVRTLEAAPVIAIDTETTSTDQMQARLVGISLAIKEGEAYYIPVGHAQGQQLALEHVIERLRPPLTDPALPKVAHNAKYDAVVLHRHGIDVFPIAFDTMVGEYLLRPDASRGKLGLKSQAFIRFGIQMTEITELIGTGKKQITMDQVPIEQAAPYAAADADITLRLLPLVRSDLEKEGLIDLLIDLEMPLIPVLGAMEQAGVLVDVPFLTKMSGEVGETLGQLKQKIYQIAGYEFNINSTQQLSQALFETLKLPTQGMRKTASGFYSTAADVLDSLRDKDTTGVIEALLQYRELEKLRSTYLDALPALVNPNTGRIHTSFNQTGTVTGRISSSDPNLQNIPIRSETGRTIRDAFIAAPGNQLIVADYSQIELRILAHVSGDDALRQAFLDDLDVHASTAAAVFNIPLDQVTSQQRRFAKAVNFGLMYGMSAFGLADRSEMTLAEAEAFVKTYFERFPKVRTYLDGSKKLAAEQGYLETLLKRKRYFPALQSRDTSPQAERDRRAAEREAVNFPLQGTAADILKLALIRLHRTLMERAPEVKMILQVHDELVLEAPEARAEEAAALAKEMMQSAFPLSIPLRADVNTGRTWGEAK